jgi:aspartyl-tRNA(Asn)/glutamyl-tRNA(Gln) amidotransferase subunit B
MSSTELLVPPDVFASYEPVIGLEVHVQLGTNTKIYCGCPTGFGAPPNTNVCPARCQCSTATSSNTP